MPDLKHRILINASPQRVYQAVTTPEGLSGWWTEDAEQHEEGILLLGFYDRTTVYKMHIDNLEPARSVQWTCETGQEWEGTRLCFELEPAANDSTILTFTHANWRVPSSFFYECNSTWGELMYRLKAYAEGNEPGPHFTKTGRAY